MSRCQCKRPYDEASQGGWCNWRAVGAGRGGEVEEMTSEVNEWACQTLDGCENSHVA